MTRRRGSRSVAGGLVAIVLTWTTGCAHHGTREALPEAQRQGAQIPRIVSEAEDARDGPCIQTSQACIALNADVTQETIRETICTPGYTKAVRPASSYTKGIKTKLLREAGIDLARQGDYELDHIVPLALGGHPRKLSNLWLQPWDGPQGARMKDILEVRLQHEVCGGRIPLLEAQGCIAEDWEECARRYPTTRNVNRAVAGAK